MNPFPPVVPHLQIVEGRPVTTSLNVAEVFGKRHDNVIRAIKNLVNDVGLLKNGESDFGLLNFAPSSYLNEQGKAQPMYQITRDGFTLLAMGFTGSVAMRFKLAYIEAFNAMERELRGEGVTGPRRRVDLHYHRGPVSPGSGLDIRYTLDLTKIVIRPSAASLKVLHRLTGVDVEDLIAEMTPPALPGLDTLAHEFLHTCTVADAGAVLPSPQLVAAARRWLAEREIVRPLTGVALLRAVRAMGYTTEKRGGGILIHGLRLNMEVVA